MSHQRGIANLEFKKNDVVLDISEIEYFFIVLKLSTVEYLIFLFSFFLSLFLLFVSGRMA